MSEEYGKIDKFKFFELEFNKPSSQFPTDSNNSDINIGISCENLNNYLKIKNAYIIHNFNTLNKQCSWSTLINNPTTGEFIINAIDNYGTMYRNINRFNHMNMSQRSPHNNNKLSNKSIKLIKCIDFCSEDCMLNLIKNLLEDNEEDIHFMKNKNKELEDTNKDLLLKTDEMKEKHNELVNRLLDKIVELSDTLNTACVKMSGKN